ncbi:hypothetical protein [Arthrobacter sp. StoSoilB5]|uniref:hypothetical protein n=1 Tax=Arthrobacter sp. StoSoilB5 TaxID=2830992 RepID=UPI001CC7DD9C|nr:hypothetical protein [Arthrobacter sp. StoSoilB5]
MSRMIPGLSIEDARLVRDEVIRRRMARGDRSAVLIGQGHGSGDPAILNERMVSVTTARIPTDSVPLLVRGVVGLHLSPESVRQALLGHLVEAQDGKLQLGLEVASHRFDDRNIETSDLVAVNGGVTRLVSSVSHAPTGAEPTFRMLRDGLAVDEGCVPPSDTVQKAVEDITAYAIRCCTPLAELFAQENDQRRGPGILVAVGIGEPIGLTSNNTVELEVAGARVAAVIADTDHFI